jgi:hypothetical protein
MNGHYMEEEPNCLYDPKEKHHAGRH